MPSKLYLYASTLLTSILLLSAQPATAQALDDPELQELLDLSLEELTVSVASKRHEKISDAPGIVTVVTADEIKRYGAQNLRDILDRLPNTQIIGSGVFPANAVSVRAGVTTHVDDKTLLLFNGRPIREAHGGGLNGDIYRSFPINIISHIEMIRGPGSVLYGTNAFTGVINIVTKDAAKNKGLQAEVGYGSFGRRTTQFSGGGAYGDFKIYGGLNAIKSDGDNFTITGENTVSGNFKQSEQSSVQGAFQASWNGLSVNAILGDDRTPNVGVPVVFASKVGDLNTVRNFVDIGYEHDITENWSTSINVTHNWHKFDFPSVGVPVESKSKGWLAEATTHGRLFDEVNIVAGGIYDNINGTLLGIPVQYEAYRLGLYGQADYKPLEWLKLVAGIQWNRPEDSKPDYSPRFSAIANFNKNWGIKLLYGEAFRSPFAAQSFVNLGTFVGNPDLEPEQIKTIDAQLFYESNDVQTALTVYDSKATNVHERQTTGGISTTVNGGTINFRGVELESKAKLTDMLSFIGSASWQENQKKYGADDFTFSPNLMIKTGLSYESDDGYTLSVFNTHFGDPTRVSTINPAVNEVNPEAESYNLLSANLNINLNKTLNLSNMPDMEFSLFGQNLLNEKVYFPAFNRQVINTLPHHSGRALYGKITVKF